MRPLVLAGTCLLFACEGAPVVDFGTTLPMDSAAPDPCAVVEGPTGLAEGIFDCDPDDLCGVAQGPAWLGLADPAAPDACPMVQVEVEAFRIDRTEVTRANYQTCVDAGGCTSAVESCDAHAGEEGGAPVTCVDWQQAADYCAWMGKRLPTEIEWEKAARGTEGAMWAWGEIPPDCNHANFRYVAAYCRGMVVPVGTYPGQSAFGLLDTVGNAWEWTNDWYDAEAWRRIDPEAPMPPESDCRDRVGGEVVACHAKVIRGGAYNTTEATTRGGARSFAEPSVFDDNIGFRCAEI